MKFFFLVSCVSPGQPSGGGGAVRSGSASVGGRRWSVKGAADRNHGTVANTVIAGNTPNTRPRNHTENKAKHTEYKTRKLTVHKAMALFHFKQTRTEDQSTDSFTLRVKPEGELKQQGWGQQQGCRSHQRCGQGEQQQSWGQQQSSSGWGGGGGRGLQQVAGVDMRLVMLQTIGEESARIREERENWLHRMSGS